MTNSKLQKGIGIIKIMQNFPHKNQLKQLFFFDLNKTLHRLWDTCFGKVHPVKTHLTKIDGSIQETIRLVFKEKYIL